MNKVQRKLSLLLALVLLLLCALSACTDPSVGSEHVTELEQFGEYNQYVEELLADSFRGSFPRELPSECSDSVYCYDYQCAALGEAVFSLYLSCEADQSLYSSEQTRISELTSDAVTLNSGKLCRLVNCDQDALEEYFNDILLDGYVYCFEIVIFDEPSMQIEYLTSYYVEGISKPAHLDDVLLEIKEAV